MQEFGFRSDDLLDFIDELRRYGYRITPEQCISAQNLLLGLAAFGNPNDLASRLSTYLAPILCTSPEEQEGFEYYFNQWQYRWANQNAITKESVKSANLLERVYEVLSSLLRRHRLILILIIVTSAVGLIWFSQNYRRIFQSSLTLTGHVNNSSGVPIGNVAVKYKGQSTYSDANGVFTVSYRESDLPLEIGVEYPGYEPLTYRLVDSQNTSLTIILQKTGSRIATSPPSTNNPFQFSLQIIIAVLTLMILATGVAWSLLRRATLRKKLTRENVKIEQLFVKGAGQQFARVLALRRIAQELRRPEAISSSEINVAATINETITSGIFTSVTSPRRASPEYLVLIDRAGFNDQQASLENEIVQRLIKSDVYMNRFYFQNDPRLCRRDEGKTSYVSLRELAALYGNRRLIIFGDGAAFFNPISGRLERWTSIFANWQRRVLLTPQDINTDYRRSVLLDQGFVVMPAGKESLAALADILNETPSTAKWSRKSEPFPNVLLDRPERWLDSHSPSNEILDDLCEELISFLGEEGYTWLAACAVYPMLNWDLTLYLGYKLSVDYKIRSEYWVNQRFKALMQLPWFRHGSMPDWLRTRLIFDLSFDQKRHVRKALEELLISSLRTPKGLALPIVIQRPDGNWTYSILKKMLRIANRSAMRGQLRDLIKKASAESPLRDHVFLSFMTRFTYNELVVTVPQKVKKALTSKHKSKVSQVLSLVANYLQHRQESLPEQSGYEFLIPPSGSQKQRSSSVTRTIPDKEPLRETIRDQISKIRNTSATYNARLFTFAFFSLSAWLLWVLQYAILLAAWSSSFASGFFLKVGLWLAVMENALWASAILSLHFKEFSRKSLMLLLVTFSVIIALVAYQTTILTSPLFTLLEGVSAAAIFTVLAISITQLRLSKLYAVAFFIHGFFQWIWRSLWLTSSATTLLVAKLAFPLWRILLLIVWIKLILEMWQRVRPSNKNFSNIMDGVQPPNFLTLKVMISSTVSDLDEERKAADRAISGLRLTRIEAETFGNVANSPKAICALLAEQCDIFILIIGERYGHIIESEGISIVEFEYQVARAQNPTKILVYVKEGVDREPRLKQFLKRLQDFEHGYFTSLFTTAEDLHQKIQRDIARWLNITTEKQSRSE